MAFGHTLNIGQNYEARNSDWGPVHSQFSFIDLNSGWVVGALLNAAKHDGRSLLRILTIIDQQSSEKVTREL